MVSMRETEAQIQETLAIAGEDIEFSFGVIKGIPGQDVINVQGFNSPYDIEKQDISFQISYLDFYENVIVEKDTFIYMLGEIQYNFEVTSYSSDLLGWVELKVKFISVE